MLVNPPIVSDSSPPCTSPPTVDTTAKQVKKQLLQSKGPERENKKN